MRFVGVLRHFIHIDNTRLDVRVARRHVREDIPARWKYEECDDERKRGYNLKH